MRVTKKMLEEEVRMLRFAATHNCKFVEELNYPVVTPRKEEEFDYLYKMSKRCLSPSS